MQVLAHLACGLVSGRGAIIARAIRAAGAPGVFLVSVSLIGPAPPPNYSPHPQRLPLLAPPGKPVATRLVPVSVNVDPGKPGPPVNEDLVGFDGPGPARAAAAIKDLHPAYIRTDVSFEGTYGGKPVYNCATGAWNPALLDERVQQIRALGARPELIVDYMPACLATDTPPTKNPTRSLPDPGVHSTEWIALVKKMALHEISDEGVRTFEIWNEPDWVFWNDGLAGYLELYSMTARALEAAARATGTKIEVGGPALANVLGSMDTKWLDPFLAYVAANHLPLDFLSWHLYADDPDSGPQPGVGRVCVFYEDLATNPCWYNPHLSAGLYASEAAAVKRALARYPELHPKLWVDEWNVNGEYDPRQAGPYGGAFVAAVLDAAEQVGIDRMCYFFVATSSKGPLGDWGVLDGNNHPVPAYYAFSYWHDLAGRLLPVTVIGGGNPFAPGSGGVGAVASTSARGVVHVLLFDFLPFDPSGNYGTMLPTPTGAEVTLGLSDMTHASLGTDRLISKTLFVQPTETSIGDAAKLVASVAGSAPYIRIDLPSEGVALVTFRPVTAKSSHDLAGWLLAVVVAAAIVLVLGSYIVVLRARRRVGQP